MIPRLQRISFLTKNWRNDENCMAVVTKILIFDEFDEIGEIRDVWQNVWRNLHFLANEEWHFWRQNLAEI